MVDRTIWDCIGGRQAICAVGTEIPNEERFPECSLRVDSDVYEISWLQDRAEGEATVAAVEVSSGPE